MFRELIYFFYELDNKRKNNNKIQISNNNFLRIQSYHDKKFFIGNSEC